MSNQRLSSEVFTNFIAQFKARYGDGRMNSESIKMWYSKLGFITDVQFKKVTEQLLGEREKVFGWKVVSDKKELMFPPEDEQSALERQWSKNPELTGNQDKKKHVTQFMQGLLDKIKDGKAEEWKMEYAREFLKTWGRQEAQRIIRKIMSESFVNDDCRVFCGNVSELLYEEAKK